MLLKFTQPKSLVLTFFAQIIGLNHPDSKFKKSDDRSFSTAVKIFSLLVVAVLSMQKASAQLNLNFGKNVILKSGTAKTLGAKYLYSKVNDTLDCIVTIKEVVNAYLTTLDNNDVAKYGGQVYRFQPIISASSSTNSTSYIRFNFQLIKTGTYSNGSGTVITPSDPVWFRAYDIDGNGDNSSLKEFVELNSVFTGAWVDAPTLLTPITPLITGETAYTINNSTTNGNNLSSAGNLAFNGFIYSNTVSSWDVVGGSKVGSNGANSITHDSTNIGDGDRINSWSFNYNEVVPGVDFGDAPASYNVPTGGTGTIIPAYSIVPSDASTINVYLGSNKPDVDYDPSGNINANVDDNNNVIDDEDGFKGTYFPKYTAGSTTYNCTIAATNNSAVAVSLYGFIDFNGDGKFDPIKEVSSKVVVPANSGTKSYTVNFTFVLKDFIATPNNRYARFRIATSDAEAAAPTGKAMDGEVEDYLFNTALKITGTVYDDNNGITDNLINNAKATVNGHLNNAASTPFYAILLDSLGKVLQSVMVPNNGMYVLDSAGTNGKFTVVLSTINPAFGTTPTLASLNSLPTGFAYTSQGITSITPAGNKLQSGNFATHTVISDITTMDFGWNALPETDNKSTTINSPSTGTKYPLSGVPLTGSDLEDSKTASSISNGGTFIITTIPTGAIIYYNGSPVIAGQKITSYDPTKLLLQFTTAGNKSFTYQTVDAAGMPDASPATYAIASNAVLPLNDIVLSANVQNGVVKLTLVAKDENQVARYAWEQSKDGTTFTTIGSVVYQATTASSNVYGFTTMPTSSANIIYFRTVQYSLDGTTLISNTVAVKLKEVADAQAIVMPTIVKDITNIKISSATTQVINLNIVDNTGRMVMRKQTTLSAGTNTFAIDGFDKLSNGAYYIQIAGIDNQSVLKIIVQH